MTIATIQEATRTGLREVYVVQNGSGDFLMRGDNDDWWDTVRRGCGGCSLKQTPRIWPRIF